MQRSFAFSDAPGLHVIMYDGACGIVMFDGDPILNGATAATIIEMNKDRFVGGVAIMTTTQLNVAGNAMAGFDMSLRGDDYRTAAWTWLQTVNTRRPPGRSMVMTIRHDPARVAPGPTQ